MTAAILGLDRFHELSDRADIADLLVRQGRWLDERGFADAAAIFTSDAAVHTQSGQSRGLDALRAQAQRVHARFAAIQHVITDVLIDIDGDRATVSANLIATFVRDNAQPAPTLTVGERYRLEAARTPDGWRFSRVDVTPVWRSGDLPGSAPISR
jgi:hypothetical protein